LFGFVYVDPEAGFTFDLAGQLKLDAQDKYVRIPDGMEGLGRRMVRLDAEKNPPAALLPKAAIEQLGLPEVPDWLKHYADTSDPVTHRVRWGSHYNHVGASRRALTYLEPAHKEKPDAEGLAFELGYAYNALERFNDALAVLKQAFARHPEEVRLGNEIAYAYNALGRYEDELPILKQVVARHPDDVLLGAKLAEAYFLSGKLDAAVQEYLRVIPHCEAHARGPVTKSALAKNLSLIYERLDDAPNAEKWRANAKA